MQLLKLIAANWGSANTFVPIQISVTSISKHSNRTIVHGKMLRKCGVSQRMDWRVSKRKILVSKAKYRVNGRKLIGQSINNIYEHNFIK